MSTSTDRYFINHIIHRIAYASIIIATMLSGLGCVKEDAPTHESTTLVGIGDTAPDFEVRLLDGSTTNLSSYRGKIVMLILFSTSCPDCKAQFDKMAQLYSQSKPKFHILAISRDESIEQTQEFINGYNAEIMAGIDPGKEIYEKYATRYVPRNFLIGHDGRIKALTVEYQEEEFLSIWNKAEELTQ